MSAESQLASDVIHAWLTSPLTQTLVGAGAGALIAFHRQNIKEKKIELEKNIGLINYSLIALSVNIERVINAKKFIAKRADDAKTVKSLPGIEDYLKTGILPTHDIKNQLSGKLNKYFSIHELDGKDIVKIDFTETDLFLIQSDCLFLELPESKEMAGIAKEHPSFILLTHKSNEYLKELNDTNREITQCIHKSARAPIPDKNQLNILLSLVEKMDADVDTALFFMNKCKDKIYQICDETLPEKRLGIYKLTVKEEFLKYMPKKDYLPSYENI